MTRGRKPTIPNLAQAVSEACRAILAKGKRPTQRNVRELLLKEYDAAPSYGDLGPPLKEWKTERQGGRAVQAVVRAYFNLDVERQKAFRDATGLIPKP